MIDEPVTLDLITLPPSVFSVYSLFSVVKSDFNIGDIKNTEKRDDTAGRAAEYTELPGTERKEKKETELARPQNEKFLVVKFKSDIISCEL